MVLDLRGAAVGVGFRRSEVEGGAGGGCKLFVRRRKVMSSLQRRRLNSPQQLERMLEFGTNGRRGKTAVQKKKRQLVKTLTPVNLRGVGHLVHFEFLQRAQKVSGPCLSIFVLLTERLAGFHS